MQIIYSVLLDNQIIASFNNLKLAILEFETAKEYFSAEDGYKELTIVDWNDNVIEYHNF